MVTVDVRHAKTTSQSQPEVIENMEGTSFLADCEVVAWMCTAHNMVAKIAKATKQSGPVLKTEVFRSGLCLERFAQVNEHRFFLQRSVTPRCADFADVGVAGLVCNQCEHALTATWLRSSKHMTRY